MKKIALVMLVGLLAVPSVEGAGFPLFGPYRVDTPDKLVAYTVGARDLRYGEWLAGYGTEVLWVRRKEEGGPIFYLAANHLFNYNQAGKGAIGAVVGINTGKAGETIVKAANIFSPAQAKRLLWLQGIANYISIEGGGGYKFYGVPQGQSNWYYQIGGKVKVPLDKFWSWVSKK